MKAALVDLEGLVSLSSSIPSGSYLFLPPLPQIPCALRLMRPEVGIPQNSPGFLGLAGGCLVLTLGHCLRIHDVELLRCQEGLYCLESDLFVLFHSQTCFWKDSGEFRTQKERNKVGSERQRSLVGQCRQNKETNETTVHGLKS